MSFDVYPNCYNQRFSVHASFRFQSYELRKQKRYKLPGNRVNQFTVKRPRIYINWHRIIFRRFCLSLLACLLCSFATQKVLVIVNLNSSFSSFTVCCLQLSPFQLIELSVLDISEHLLNMEQVNKFNCATHQSIAVSCHFAWRELMDGWDWLRKRWRSYIN